ncbi:MAG: WG repeat-containing protein [Bacteroidia bacterium]|nr:WG repeat-containing protein [Bacteroidia bacterium]
MNKKHIPLVWLLVLLSGAGQAQEKWRGKHERYSEGLAVFYKKNRAGYINEKREIVIPAQYDAAYYFSEGLAAVSVSGKVGFIDTKGEMVLGPDEKYCLGAFRNGYAHICNGQKIGLMNVRGDTIIPPDYDGISEVNNGFVQVARQGENYQRYTALLNLKNEVIFPFTLNVDIHLYENQDFLVSKKNPDCEQVSCRKKSYYWYALEKGEYHEKQVYSPYCYISEEKNGFTIVGVNANFNTDSWYGKASPPSYFGLVDKERNEVLPPVFEKIQIEEKYIELSLPRKRVEYFRIDKKSEGYLVFDQQEKINELKGRTFRYEYDSSALIIPSAEKLVPAYMDLENSNFFLRDPYFGYVSPDDNALVLPFMYKKAYPFVGDLAVVEKLEGDYLPGNINDKEYSHQPCHSAEKQYLNIRRDGQAVEGEAFDFIEEATAQSSIGIIGFVDGRGKMRKGIHPVADGGMGTETLYDDICYLENGLFKLMKDQKFWLFHENKGMLFSEGIAEINRRGYLRNGFMIYQLPDSTYRFIDSTGKLLPGAFDQASPFQNNEMARVVKGGKSFMIDKEGKEILPYKPSVEKRDDSEYRLLISSNSFHDNQSSFNSRMDISPNGKYILSCFISGEKSRLNIWNSYTGELVNSFGLEIENSSSTEIISRFVDHESFVLATPQKIEVYNLLTGEKRKLILKDNPIYFDGLSGKSILIQDILHSGDRSKIAIAGWASSRKKVILLDLDDFSQTVLNNDFERIRYLLNVRDNIVISALEGENDKWQINVFDWKKNERLNSLELDLFPEEAEYASGFLFFRHRDEGEWKITALRIRDQKKFIVNEEMTILGTYPENGKVFFKNERGISYFDLNEEKFYKDFWSWGDDSNDINIPPNPMQIDRNGRIFSLLQSGIAMHSLEQRRLIGYNLNEFQISFIHSSSNGKIQIINDDYDKITFDLKRLEIDTISKAGNPLDLETFSPRKKFVSRFGKLGITGYSYLVGLENNKKLLQSRNGGMKGFFSKDGNRYLFFNKAKSLDSIPLVLFDLNSLNPISEFYLKEKVSKYISFLDYRIPFSTNSSLSHAFYIHAEKDKIIKVALETGESEDLLLAEEYESWLKEEFYSLECIGEDRLVYISPNEEVEERLKIYNWKKKKLEKELLIPAFGLDHLHYNDSLQLLVLASDNGLIRFYDTKHDSLLGLTLLIKEKSYLAFDQEKKFYFGDKELFKEIRFAKAGRVEASASFELSYNRPDSLMALYSFTDSVYAQKLGKLISLRKVNQGIGAQSNGLICSIENNSPTYFQETKEFNLDYKLVNFNKPIQSKVYIKVNGVIVGEEDLLVDKEFRDSRKLSLQEGLNRIELFAKSGQDSMSNIDVIEVNSIAPLGKRKLYFLGLGIENYDNWGKLTYSVDDIRKAANTFQNSPLFDEVVIDTFFNENVDQSILKKLSGQISELKPDDYVIIYLSGHGKTDLGNGEFYFIGKEAETEKYANESIPYKKFEELLRNTPSRNRIMFIDACESGNVDQSKIGKDSVRQNGEIIGKGLRPRDSKNNSTQKEFELMESLFNNYNNSFGGVTIAASSGYEFANEHEDLKNGVFTYFLVESLTTKEADLDKDGEIYLSELLTHLKEQIAKSSYSKQTVSARNWNLEYDYRIW